MNKIALFVDDNIFHDIDISKPQKGNPGIGGTEYCFAMLTWILKKYTDTWVAVFHTGNNMFPKCDFELKVHSIYDAIEKCKKCNVDYLIIRYADTTAMDKKLFTALEENQVNAIGWLHNYLHTDGLKGAMHSRIKALVMVGKQQYDRYIDHDIIKKCCYIYHSVESDTDEKISNVGQNHAVTYVGAIVPVKGFHILAKNWKKILKKVPDAELNVIGNGTLYNADSKLGKYGVAGSIYEGQFMKWLKTEEGNILPSVHFLGKMGSEKKDVFKRTCIGIINPTARTETFGLGAVEMQASGVPVVLRRKNAFHDVVANNESGFLFRSERQMCSQIIKLLTDSSLAEKMGNHGILFVREKFSGERIAEEWKKLFEKLSVGEQLPYSPPNDEFRNNFKWLRILNRWFRIKLGLYFLPSIVDVECYIQRTFRKLFLRKQKK